MPCPHSIGLFLVIFSFCIRVLDASTGDADPVYRDCLGECEENGCVGRICFPPCNYSIDGVDIHGPWYMHEPLFLWWKQSRCESDCRYHCMLEREKQREALGYAPVKYHGRWSFKHVLGIQEPLSMAFSLLNLAMHFQGWLSFFILLNYKLPLKKDRTPYYDYATLWHVYGFLSMNFWFWSAVFHSLDMELTERLDYSSAAALSGYSLILALVRCFNARIEASRVMIAAPLLAFVTTHILYINFFELSQVWNMKVCLTLAVIQLMIWATWAVGSHHQSCWKLLFVVAGSGLGILLEVYDFPPYKGFADAHAVWHATSIPLTCIWWSFVRDDAQACTTNFVQKSK